MCSLGGDFGHLWKGAQKHFEGPGVWISDSGSSIIAIIISGIAKSSSYWPECLPAINYAGYMTQDSYFEILLTSSTVTIALYTIDIR